MILALILSAIGLAGLFEGERRFFRALNALQSSDQLGGYRADGSGDFKRVFHDKGDTQ